MGLFRSRHFRWSHFRTPQPRHPTGISLLTTALNMKLCFFENINIKHIERSTGKVNFFGCQRQGYISNASAWTGGYFSTTGGHKWTSLSSKPPSRADIFKRKRYSMTYYKTVITYVPIWEQCLSAAATAAYRDVTNVDGGNVGVGLTVGTLVVTAVTSSDVLREMVSPTMAATMRATTMTADKMKVLREDSLEGQETITISLTKHDGEAVADDSSKWPADCPIAGLILGLRPANERRRYFVTMSLSDWVQA